MDYNQAFLDYLEEKSKKPSFKNTCMRHQGEFANLVVSRPVVPEMVKDLFKSINYWKQQDRAEAYRLLLEYADFIETREPDTADALRDGYKLSLENIVCQNAKASRERIVIIPPDTKIAPEFLGGLTNDDFVTALDTFQNFLISCYSDIEIAPEQWGYPFSHQKIRGGWSSIGYGDYRVRNFLSSFYTSGEFDGHILTVNKKAFFKNVYESTKKEAIQTLDCFTNLGLIIEGVEDNSNIFVVSFPDNPNVLRIIPLFFVSGGCRRGCEGCSNKGVGCHGDDPVTRNHFFSHRFFEDPAAQTHEAEFLVVTDPMPEHLREIHFWLYDEAKKFGFDFDPYAGMAFGCVLYRRGGWGGKNMPFVGMFDNGAGDNNFAAHAVLKRVFKSHPEEAAKLLERFPDAIANPDYDCPSYCGTIPKNICSNSCSYEIDGTSYRSCGYKSFIFLNPTFEDVKLIIELWKLEHKIK